MKLDMTASNKMNKSPITVKSTISAPIEKIWAYWTEPKHIMNWCNASDDWRAPNATNDLRAGGKFLTRMEAKDGSAGFDFEGVYTIVRKHERIEYKITDGRNVKIEFISKGDKTEVIETFDPENINSPELQKSGWQAILDNFKKYSENN